MTNIRQVDFLPLVNQNVYWPIIGHLYCKTSFFIRHFTLFLLNYQTRPVWLDSSETTVSVTKFIFGFSILPLYFYLFIYVLHTCIFNKKSAAVLDFDFLWFKTRWNLYIVDSLSPPPPLPNRYFSSLIRNMTFKSILHLSFQSSQSKF